VIPIGSPTFLRVFPDELKPIFGAVVLNAFFNRTTKEEAEADTFLAAQTAEHI
jgi:uric acid transporter